MPKNIFRFANLKPLALAGIFALSNYSTAEDKPLDELLFESSEYLRTGRAAQALDAMQAHENLHGSKREFQNNLAIAYLGNNQPEDALAILRNLVDSDPLFSIIAHNLLEMELQLAGVGAEQVNPILFVQTVDTFIDSSINSNSPIDGDPANQTADAHSNEQQAVVPISREALALRNNAIRSLVQSWADAWSSKNFDRYIRHYTADFQPENGLSHAKWKAQRADRLSKPGQIEVTISNIKINNDNDQPLIQFDQHYQSANYSDNTRKEMRFTKDGERWKIASEITLKNY